MLQMLVLLCAVVACGFLRVDRESMLFGDFGYIHGLRTLWPIANLELNLIAFLKALVSFRADGAVVYKNIGTIVPSDETEPLGIVEPLDLPFNASHDLFPLMFSPIAMISLPDLAFGSSPGSSILNVNIFCRAG